MLAIIGLFVARRMQFALIISACAALVVATGCSSPCVELSKARCRCEGDDNARRACLREVDSLAAERAATESDDKRCDDLLSSPSCAGDAICEALDSCGIDVPGSGG